MRLRSEFVRIHLWDSITLRSTKSLADRRAENDHHFETS